MRTPTRPLPLGGGSWPGRTDGQARQGERKRERVLRKVAYEKGVGKPAKGERSTPKLSLYRLDLDDALVWHIAARSR